MPTEHPRRPRLTRDEIVQAALEIAEQDGIKNVSMRKVARRLGAGTMSLYHYVRTKDDLLALMDDEIMGEIVIPEDEMPDGWRARLTLIAEKSLAAWMKRPWLIDDDDDFRITANGMRHMEQSIAALEGVDLDPARKFEIVNQVDDYLFGFAVRERKIDRDQIMGSAQMDEVIAFVEEEMASGDYPQLTEMFSGDSGLKEQWDHMIETVYDDDRFERGLNRLLDGIEADLTRIGALPD